MQSSIVRRARVAALVATAACAMCAGGAQAAHAAAAPADSFDVYSGSQPLAGYAPGAVLSSRTESFHLSGVSLPITVIELLYRSTGALGQPTATVTSILEPPAPSTTPKVVSYQSFYDSLNPADEPSEQFAGDGTSGGEVVTAEDALIAPLLTAGITVVVPDTEGETADFAAGPEYGMNTLDSLRAVFNDSAADGVPASAPAALIGYSGGAIATGWAAQLAPGYAPDINQRLVGAAEGGILVDPAHNLNYVGGSTVWAGVIPMAIIGVARAYNVNLVQYMNSYGVSVYHKLQNASISQALGQYPGLTWQKIVMPQYDNPDSVAPFVTEVNKLDMGTATMPTIPMFMGQGTGGTLEGTPVGGPGIGAGDGVMIAGDVRTLAREYCASGDSVHYEQYDTSHFTSIAQWTADAEPWIMDRLNGETEPGNCSTIAAGNSLALQQIVGAAATPVTSASFTVHTSGSHVRLGVTLPAGASRFSFRWQHGVSFGARHSPAYVGKEIALFSEPAGTRDAVKVTQLSRLRGRVAFALRAGSLTQFSFQLSPRGLHLTRAERRSLTRHHVTTLTGTFTARSVTGVIYRKTVSYPL